MTPRTLPRKAYEDAKTFYARYLEVSLCFVSGRLAPLFYYKAVLCQMSHSILIKFANELCKSFQLKVFILHRKKNNLGMLKILFLVVLHKKFVKMLT